MTTRRDFVLGASALVVAACHRKRDALVCTDVSALPKEEAAPRRLTGYVDRANDPAQTCESCVQYIEAASDGACGACKLVKGPIHPLGGCTLYAKRA
jgi:hypothetical protein